MPDGTMRTPVRIECLERDHGISLGDLFGNAVRHYPDNIIRGVVLPQHAQQNSGGQQQARIPILTTLNRYNYLPTDIGELVEKFMQCRPETGFGVKPDDPKLVEYIAACEAFTQSLEDNGITHLRVI